MRSKANLIPWKVRLLIAAVSLVPAIVIGTALVHGTELPLPRMHHHGIVINLTMKREKGPAPKYVAPSIDRPAGTP